MSINRSLMRSEELTQGVVCAIRVRSRTSILEYSPDEHQVIQDRLTTKAAHHESFEQSVVRCGKSLVGIGADVC